MVTLSWTESSPAPRAWSGLQRSWGRPSRAGAGSGAGVGRGGAGRGAGGALGRTAPGTLSPAVPQSVPWRAGSGTGCCWRTPSSWCWCAGGGSRGCGGTALPGWPCCGQPAWWWGCECGAGGRDGAPAAGKASQQRSPGFPVPSSNSAGRTVPRRLIPGRDPGDGGLI